MEEEVGTLGKQSCAAEGAGIAAAAVEVAWRFLGRSAMGPQSDPAAPLPGAPQETQSPCTQTLRASWFEQPQCLSTGGG